MIGRIVASFIAAQKTKVRESKKKENISKPPKKTVLKTKKKENKFSDNILKEL